MLKLVFSIFTALLLFNLRLPNHCTATAAYLAECTCFPFDYWSKCPTVTDWLADGCQLIWSVSTRSDSTARVCVFQSVSFCVILSVCWQSLWSSLLLTDFFAPALCVFTRSVVAIYHYIFFYCFIRIRPFFYFKKVFVLSMFESNWPKQGLQQRKRTYCSCLHKIK